MAAKISSWHYLTHQKTPVHLYTPSFPGAFYDLIEQENHRKEKLAFFGYNTLENLITLLLVFLYMSLDFQIDNSPSKQSPKNDSLNLHLLMLQSQIPSIPLHISLLLVTIS